MNHWPFIIAAYAAAISLTAGLILWSWRTMRHAERQAEQFKRR